MPARALRVCAFLIPLFAFVDPLPAQDAEPMIYGIYYRCDASRETIADDVVHSVFAPAFDGMVADGRMTSWGWLVHHTGGPWRRALYFVASGYDGVIDVLDAIGEETGERGQALSVVCPTHDDYVWSLIAASEPLEGAVTNRPPAGYSAYWVCDFGRESRADELFTEVFAPIFDRHVGPEGLRSWGWYVHEIGGEYRRLLAVDGADHKAVMRAREAITAEMQGEQAEAWREFAGICHSHQDYLWDIATHGS